MLCSCRAGLTHVLSSPAQGDAVAASRAGLAWFDVSWDQRSHCVGVPSFLTPRKWRSSTVQNPLALGMVEKQFPLPRRPT